MRSERQRLAVYDCMYREFKGLPHVSQVLPPEKYDIPWIDEIDKNKITGLVKKIERGDNAVGSMGRLLRLVVISPYLIFDFSDEPRIDKIEKIDKFRMEICNDEKRNLILGMNALRPFYIMTIKNELRYLNILGLNFPEILDADLFESYRNITNFGSEQREKWQELCWKDQQMFIKEIRSDTAKIVSLFRK